MCSVIKKSFLILGDLSHHSCYCPEEISPDGWRGRSSLGDFKHGATVGHEAGIVSAVLGPSRVPGELTSLLELLLLLCGAKL